MFVKSEKKIVNLLNHLLFRLLGTICFQGDDRKQDEDQLQDGGPHRVGPGAAADGDR